MGFTKYLFIFLSMPLIFQGTNCQPKPNFFRKDYTYIASTESFYKIHTLQSNWQEAKNRCAREGATLFYPEDKAEADAVLAFWNQTQPFYWVYIGVSSLLAKGVFETIDGRPLGDVYSTWGPGEPNNADGVEDCAILRRDGTLNDVDCKKNSPFVCKKRLSSLHWNVLCDIPDKTYIYKEGLGKCYKFHLTPMNWTEAYATCNAEQSYLAIINSEAEAEHLIKITEEAPKDKVRGNFMAGEILLGFHNRYKDGWKTVRGTSLEDSGYEKWGKGQPDGKDKELCGSMFYNGQLNDLACDVKCFFICEHDIKSLSNLFDDRFGKL